MNNSGTGDGVLDTGSVTDPDGLEFLADFGTLSAFGATERGGVERQAGSSSDVLQREWLRSWLRGHGFRVALDGIGNLYGIKEWTPGAPVVLTGSHLDSQPWGGRYDGAYGVLASAHAALRLDRQVAAGGPVPQYNVAVVDWFNEEGSRFAPSMMGSSVFTGKLALERALAIRDAHGTSVATALDDGAGRGDDTLPEVRAYAEIHVEQGRVLEDEGFTIGVVTSTWAARKFDVVVQGEQSHTGSTVMADRRDALVAAARLVVAVRALADERPDAALHTSVARFDVLPNSPVVVPREVAMNVDLRSPHASAIDEAVASLHDTIAAVEEEDGVRVTLTESHAWDRQPYHPGGVALASEVIDELELPYREIMTIAGHDSTNLKDMVPTVMLFVPSADGIAHNEAEYTTPEDCVHGVAVLTAVLQRLLAGADLGS